MRRKYLGIAIAALTTFGPMQAWGGDREIADAIYNKLKTSKNTGALKDFSLDMKVDQGIVLLRGEVANEAQKDLVLSAAKGLEGVNRLIDRVTIKSAVPAGVVAEVTVDPANAPVAIVPKVAAAIQVPVVEPSPEPQIELSPQPQVELVEANQPFSFTEALATQAALVESNPVVAAAPVEAATVEAAEAPQFEVPELPQIAPAVMEGEVQPVAAFEESRDQVVFSKVVEALGKAQREGTLKGFGVDVRCNNGQISLNGRAASASQRDQILAIVGNVDGVQSISEDIKFSAPSTPLMDVPAAPAPSTLVAEVPSATVAMPASAPMSAPQPLPQMAAAPMQMPGYQTAGHRMTGPTQAMPAAMQSGPVMGAPVMGTPVPMGPTAPVGAPRYDTPNLPNYAWPGYSAYPNYAALTYPQQYSPTAWPYIGPFYPYPQVPLGWRKVSLEWDDGWWYLDFTDR